MRDSGRKVQDNHRKRERRGWAGCLNHQNGDGSNEKSHPKDQLLNLRSINFQWSAVFSLFSFFLALSLSQPLSLHFPTYLLQLKIVDIERNKT